MFSLSFWKDAVERAVKSAAQAVLLALGGSEVANLFTIDWRIALGAALAGALISLLTSIASAPFGERGSASLITG